MAIALTMSTITGGWRAHGLAGELGFPLSTRGRRTLDQGHESEQHGDGAFLGSAAARGVVVGGGGAAVAAGAKESSHVVSDGRVLVLAVHNSRTP